MARVGGSGTPETIIGAGGAPAVQAMDVILRDAGANPAAVADVVRSMTGVEPAAAKELVTRVPCAVRTRIAPALAEALRARLVAAGGSVEVREHGAAAPELFDVLLKDRGASKINVVRAVKMLTGLELRDAVELVDDAPSVVKRKVGRDEAETILHELVEAGAVAEIRAHDATAPSPPTRASAPARTIITEPAKVVASAPAAAPTGSCEVILKQCGPNKISVIKAIRAATGLGLKDAKDLAESSGVAVKRGIAEHEAVAIARELVAAGAVAEVRGKQAPAPAPSRAPADGIEVVLEDCGAHKIAVIKLIRELTALGLREAKEMAETPGSTVKQGLSRAEAVKIQRQFVELGASVELRGGEDDEAVDEPDLVDVFLRSYGTSKILVIKEVRALTGLGLKEAKDLVEAAPRMIKEQVDREQALQLQRVLVEVGAVIELR